MVTEPQDRGRTSSGEDNQTPYPGTEQRNTQPPPEPDESAERNGTEKEHKEVEVEDRLIYMYLAAALWVLILYVGGMSMWIYLQAVDRDLDQFFYSSFMTDHCKGQPQIPTPSQIARFSLDGSIDVNLIPAKANIYRSDNNSQLLSNSSADMSVESACSSW